MREGTADLQVGVLDASAALGLVTSDVPLQLPPLRVVYSPAPLQGVAGKLFSNQWLAYMWSTYGGISL